MVLRIPRAPAAVVAAFALCITWANGGVSDDSESFWSFRPVLDSPLPQLKRQGWAISPIDYFVLARLEAAGLEPAPPADKRTLIRRATFDLTGLPPTVDEINTFLNEESPDAFERLIDRLLASPHYGERWGRHWLDVARYADSNGMDENLAYANAFRYRDWVVSAFNLDMPYDSFVRDQIAGDLLPDTGDAESFGRRVVATGFLTLGPKMLAEDDPVKMEMDIIDEQLDTVGRTFMGLTLGCARCHDHKFDPLKMADYYGLAGVFKSTKTMDNFKVVARWHERPVGSVAAIAEQEARLQVIASAKSEFNRVTTECNDNLLRDARRNVADYLLAAAALVRTRALLEQPLMADPATSSLSGTHVIEAEQFARGNVKRDFDTYGSGIGVIYNQGELPNFAEFDIAIPDSGAFQIELRFAAAESRPVKLFIDGRLIRPNAAAKPTGSWYPDTQRWSAEAILELTAGNHVIRLERDQPFPHFDKLAVVPRGPAGSQAPQTAEQLARTRGLNLEFLEQWSGFLERTRGDAASPLAAWHAAASLTPPPGGNVLFDDLRDSILKSLAQRYQQLCDEADAAWQSLRAESSGNSPKQLADPAQESLRQLLYDPKGPLALPPKPERFYAEDTVAGWTKLRDQLAELERSFTPLPETMAVRAGQPQNLRVHLRGSHLTLGDDVPRQFPTLLTPVPEPPIADGQTGRREFADWLTRPSHPLTSRVMVNRVWHWHFGTGLVRTTDNFGKLGEPPSHPELLDWLARRFIDSGWSIKAMHRAIMLSATYQMSTRYDLHGAEIDPENRLMWRASRRRLEAEAIRDAILAVSGQLDRSFGGSLLEGGNRAYVKGYPNSVYDKYEFNRRSLYLPVLRSMLYDVFQAFDFADPSTANGERATTTVAPQALFMLNAKLVSDQARNLATSLLGDASLDDEVRVRDLYERSLGRPPSDFEVARALEFTRRCEQALEAAGSVSDRRILAWQSLCRSVLASSEFVYVE